MSGVGEALAIVSCVAGLLQAYDAAGRNIDRIKERRRAWQAALPSVYLEQSVEQAKRHIVEAVEEGKQRLQGGFQTGRRLLETLAKTREDDDNVDFSVFKWKYRINLGCFVYYDRHMIQHLSCIHWSFVRPKESFCEQIALAQLAPGSSLLSSRFGILLREPFNRESGLVYAPPALPVAESEELFKSGDKVADGRIRQTLISNWLLVNDTLTKISCTFHDRAWEFPANAKVDTRGMSEKPHEPPPSMSPDDDDDDDSFGFHRAASCETERSLKDRSRQQSKCIESGTKSIPSGTQLDHRRSAVGGAVLSNWRSVIARVYGNFLESEAPQSCLGFCKAIPDHNNKSKELRVLVEAY